MSAIAAKSATNAALIAIWAFRHITPVTARYAAQQGSIRRSIPDGALFQLAGLTGSSISWW